MAILGLTHFCQQTTLPGLERIMANLNLDFSILAWAFYGLLNNMTEGLFVEFPVDAHILGYPVYLDNLNLWHWVRVQWLTEDCKEFVDGLKDAPITVCEIDLQPISEHLCSGDVAL